MYEASLEERNTAVPATSEGLANLNENWISSVVAGCESGRCYIEFLLRAVTSSYSMSNQLGTIFFFFGKSNFFPHSFSCRYNTSTRTPVYAYEGLINLPVLPILSGRKYLNWKWKVTSLGCSIEITWTWIFVRLNSFAYAFVSVRNLWHALHYMVVEYFS